MNEWRPEKCPRLAAVDLLALKQKLTRYREPNHGRSVVEILITAVPLVLLCSSMWLLLRFGSGLYLLLVVPAAGFLVRLFMIQHDCGHGSLFCHRRVNDWIGRVIGVVTLTPYDFWRQAHGIHHATSGNLDRRGTGDIDMLTVREYLPQQSTMHSRVCKREYLRGIHFVVFGPLPLVDSANSMRRRIATDREGLSSCCLAQ